MEIATAEIELSDSLTNNPILFSEKILGGRPWEKQKEIMLSVRDNQRTTVRSANGVGKDWTASEIALWWLYTRYPSIVITSAPTNRQVEEILWGEIRKKFNGSRVKLGGRLLQTKIDIEPKWYALGFATDQESQFQGFHGDNILIIFSEAQGIPKMIFDAAEGCMTSEGSRLLLIGNPIGIGTEFYKSFTSPLYNKIHISGFDSPNYKEGREVIPGVVTKKWIEDRKSEWGESNPLYQARVLGEFPSESDDTLIPLSWIMRAIDKKIEISTGKRVLGADIARYGTCESVVAEFDGYRVKIPIAKHGNNTVDNAGSIINYIRDNQVETYRQHEYEVFVDDVGVGGGVTDILQREGYKVTGLVANAVPSDPKFFDLRAEMYWCLRECFRTEVISIPKDDKLTGQLAGLHFEYTTRGQIRIESKDSMRKEGLESPDRGDAVAMAVWGHLKGGTSTRGAKIKNFDNMIGSGRGGW